MDAGAPTPSERLYLERLDGSVGSVDKAVLLLSERIGQAYLTQERIFALARAEPVTAARRALIAIVERTTPPVRLRADHDRYLRALRAANAATARLRRAALAEDLAGVFTALHDANLAELTQLPEYSAPFCKVVAPPPSVRLCDSEQPLPGGAYGAKLRAIHQRAATEFEPRAGPFPPGDVPEFYTVLLRAQVAIERALAERLRADRELRPPPRLRADHQRLLQWDSDILALARSITQAAKARQYRKIQQFFAESRTLLCDLERELSPAMLSILAFMFEGDACR